MPQCARSPRTVVTMRHLVLHRCRAELRSNLFIIRYGSTWYLHGYESMVKGSIISTASTLLRQNFVQTGGSPCLPFQTNHRYHFEHYMPSHLSSVEMHRFVSSLLLSPRLPQLRSNGCESGSLFDLSPIAWQVTCIFAACILLASLCFSQNMSSKSNSLKVRFVDKEIDVKDLDDPLW